MSIGSFFKNLFKDNKIDIVEALKKLNIFVVTEVKDNDIEKTIKAFCAKNNNYIDWKNISLSGNKSKKVRDSICKKIGSDVNIKIQDDHNAISCFSLDYILKNKPNVQNIIITGLKKQDQNQLINLLENYNIKGHIDVAGNFRVFDVEDILDNLFGKKVEKLADVNINNEAEAIQKMQNGTMDFNDLKTYFLQMKKTGVAQIMKIASMFGVQFDAQQLKNFDMYINIINSMNAVERKAKSNISSSRIFSIAYGSGTSEMKVREIVAYLDFCKKNSSKIMAAGSNIGQLKDLINQVKRQ